MKTPFFSTFICFFLFQTFGFSHDKDIDFVIENKLLTDNEKLYLVDSVLDKLPKNIKLRNNLVTLSFKKLTDDRIDDNYCKKEFGIKLARLSFTDSYHIILDQQFIDILKKRVHEKNNEERGLCFYKNSYELLISTIIHEIGHIFDFNAEMYEIFDRTRKDIYNYRNNDQGSRLLKANKSQEFKNISQMNEFKTYSLYNGDTLFYDSQKYVFVNSPSQHEFRNREEQFAVQFEYFSMDKDYACRRPNMYFYFTNILKLKPQYETDCKINKTIYLINT